MEILRRFIAKPGVSVFDATRETVGFFARIKDAFKRTADPYRSMMDVWIAAHILETGSILITYDKHFAMVPGLGCVEQDVSLKRPFRHSCTI